VQDVLRGGAWIARPLGKADSFELACAIDVMSGQRQERATLAELGALLARQIGASEDERPIRLVRRVLRAADAADATYDADSE
jgi:hypothetical protein